MAYSRNWEKENTHYGKAFETASFTIGIVVRNDGNSATYLIA